MLHRHHWRVRRSGVLRYETGACRSFVVLACDTCAKTRRKTISRREMTGEEINAVALKRYHQVTTFTRPEAAPESAL